MAVPYLYISPTRVAVQSVNDVKTKAVRKAKHELGSLYTKYSRIGQPYRECSSWQTDGIQEWQCISKITWFYERTCKAYHFSMKKADGKNLVATQNTAYAYKQGYHTVLISKICPYFAVSYKIYKIYCPYFLEMSIFATCVLISSYFL